MTIEYLRMVAQQFRLNKANVGNLFKTRLPGAVAQPLIIFYFKLIDLIKHCLFGLNILSFFPAFFRGDLISYFVWLG